MSMSNDFKDIFERYQFLAQLPAKIDTALGVCFGSILFFLAGLDFACNVSWNLFSGTFIVFNFCLAVGSIISIGFMKQTPVTYSEKELREFDFKKSLTMTRYCQRELRQNIDTSTYMQSAKHQSGVQNNILRFLSFVVVLDGEAYIYIRCTRNIDSRRNIKDLEEVASDLASVLNLRKSSFQKLLIEKSEPLGHSRLAPYYVQRLG